MVGIAMNKIQLILVSILVPVLAIFWFVNRDDFSVRNIIVADVPTMHIGDIPIKVEIVESDEERAQGLSNREKLEDSEGMLFVFPESGYHPFWMKDMLFPIDIIWIDENLEVIAIDKNIRPNTYPQTFRPPRPAKYVLETNVHFSDTYSLREGLSVRLPIQLVENN
jgi:uncharacterized membrane protein (UPF0127 family)